MGAAAGAVAVGAALFGASKQRQDAKAGKRAQKRIQRQQEEQRKVEEKRLAEETSEFERRRILALRGRQGRRSLIRTSQTGVPSTLGRPETTTTNLGGTVI